MDELGRELTRSEKAKIRRAVEINCANYDREYGCLPLETGCYMNTIGYVGSSLCQYFREAILPASPELLAIFQRGGTRNCKWCGQPFPEAGHRQYCSRKVENPEGFHFFGKAEKRGRSNWKFERRASMRGCREAGGVAGARGPVPGQGKRKVACNAFAGENAHAAGLFRGQIKAGRWSYRPGRKRQG